MYVPAASITYSNTMTKTMFTWNLTRIYTDMRLHKLKIVRFNRQMNAYMMIDAIIKTGSNLKVIRFAFALCVQDIINFI